MVITAAQQVDQSVVISSETRWRIVRFYNRDSVIIAGNARILHPNRPSRRLIFQPDLPAPLHNEWTWQCRSAQSQRSHCADLRAAQLGQNSLGGYCVRQCGAGWFDIKVGIEVPSMNSKIVILNRFNFFAIRHALWGALGFGLASALEGIILGATSGPVVGTVGTPLAALTRMFVVGIGGVCLGYAGRPGRQITRAALAGLAGGALMTYLILQFLTMTLSYRDTGFPELLRPLVPVAWGGLSGAMLGAMIGLAQQDWRFTVLLSFVGFGGMSLAEPLIPEVSVWIINSFLSVWDLTPHSPWLLVYALSRSIAGGATGLIFGSYIGLAFDWRERNRLSSLETQP